MSSDQLIQRLLSEDVLTPVLITFGVVSVIAIRSVCGVIKHTARERTRREIAAFIAEGTLSPEQGERILRAEGKECKP